MSADASRSADYSAGRVLRFFRVIEHAQDMEEFLGNQ